MRDKAPTGDSNEQGTWAERLAFLTDDEMGRLTEDLRESIELCLSRRYTPSMSHQVNDSKALATWRERNPGSPIRKAKSIRNTREYQEILREVEREFEATHPVDWELKEMEFRILGKAGDLDALAGALSELRIPRDELDCHGLSGNLDALLTSHAPSIMSDEVLDGVARRLSAKVAATLSTGNLEEYAYEDDYDKPYWWHAKKHASIGDLDELLRWVTCPEWGGEWGMPPIVCQILGTDDQPDDDVTQATIDALLSSSEGKAMGDLADLLMGGWEHGDEIGNWAMRARNALLSRLGGLLPETEVLDLVRQNPRYTEMFQELERRQERDRRMVESIVERIPENPVDLYPIARSMSRHFVLHVGPTNSGKTHDAIDALGKAPSGAYLAPLRLLAYEQYERLNDNGCPCSLLTGEEEVPVAGARHVASTIEMLDYSTPIDVAVIDEAQMMADRDRGSHWTEAILGVPAREVHVCLAPEAEDIMVRLVEACGDTCEVIRHERMSPLEQERGSFSFPKDVCAGDAIIVFTRRAVHAVAAEIARAGKSTSMIYGALPYDVRHREAERFASGETDVVVATDAIGMGMNLPIRRVVLLEQAKFDGQERRLLTGIEIRQIAGRAGRYGIHERGLWKSANENKKMGRLADAEPVPLSVAPVGFVETLLGVEGTVSQLMEKWVSLGTMAPFAKTSLERERALAERLESRVSPEVSESPDGKRLVYRFATMAFKENMEELLYQWQRMFDSELAGKPFAIRVPSGDVPKDMERLEAEYAHTDLLHQYCRTFGYVEHYEEIEARRRLISERISEMIAGNVFEPRRCRECGRPLPWNWPYPMCDPCHERLHPRRRWHNDGW